MGYNASIPVIASADLTALQYRAAGVDGDVAADAREAAGILQNKPASGEDASLVYTGRSNYRAGGAVTRGNLLTVAASGWITAASSGGLSIGRALETVASGGIAEGVFDFTVPGRA